MTGVTRADRIHCIMRIVIPLSAARTSLSCRRLAPSPLSCAAPMQLRFAGHRATETEHTGHAASHGSVGMYEARPLTPACLHCVCDCTGSCSVRWDNATMHAIVTVFALHI